MIYNKYNKMQMNVRMFELCCVNTYIWYKCWVQKCKTELQSHSYSADNIQENQYKYWKLLK